MPLLTGLFGISVLLVASQGTLPVQHFSGLRIEDKAVIKYSLLGTGAGVAVGWLPGLSTASANGVLASMIGYEKDRRSYILATNAANTANAFIGLAALFALSRMRNGVMAAIAEIPLPSMSELMVIGMLAACAAYVITIRLSASAWRLNGFDSGNLNRTVIAFIVLLSIVLHRSLRFLYPAARYSCRSCPPSRQCPENVLHGCDHGPGDALLVWYCVDLSRFLALRYRIYGFILAYSQTIP